jgi:hypothetical protein
LIPSYYLYYALSLEFYASIDSDPTCLEAWQVSRPLSYGVLVVVKTAVVTEKVLR